MLSAYGSNTSRAPVPVEEATTQDVLDGTAPADFNRLSGEQIERLIAHRQTPAPWRLDPAQVHPPEPFGMIA